MANPYGWLATRADGGTVLFSGAQPNPPDFASVRELATIDDYVDAQNLLRTPNTVAAAQAFKLAALTAACAAAITGGFTSSALGAAHLYGSQDTDQLNLGGAMVAAAMGGSAFTTAIPCSADSGATWPAVSHTAAQVATAFADLRAWVEAQRTKNRTLAAQVAAATTVDAVNVIVWG